MDSREKIKNKIEDVIWNNIHVSDDTGLSIGEAAEEILQLLEKNNLIIGMPE